ncbi:hypothetical protein CS022_06510 [Veronia nyctiphanis]|uniref:Uncharacterized protein n=1 Tax=Veronia nyctiphanis TaxID=1278244 RepID=A0A4Q0YS13_9GAMM|nr:hypothetical protein CS022_06510 [Veronia nyctiphanis]
MKSERFYYMDNLRAAALLLGVLLHSILAYSPRTINDWVTYTPQNINIFSNIYLFIHLFRMPFFLSLQVFFVVTYCTLE